MFSRAVLGPSSLPPRNFVTMSTEFFPPREVRDYARAVPDKRSATLTTSLEYALHGKVARRIGILSKQSLID